MENTLLKPIQITEATFESEVTQSDKPVLIDFWAEWCSPCRAMNPVINDLAQDFAGKVKIAKVDIDANPTLAEKYHVQSIPTFLIFRDGKVVSHILGAVSKATLKTKISEQLIS
jgi:thioredoxin 1